MRKAKIIISCALKFLGIILLLGALWISLLACGFIYEIEFRQTLVSELASPDGAYSLKIYQIGEPAWPFGPVDGKFVLYADGKKVTQIKFTQWNDGGNLYIGENHLSWQEDCVQIFVIGEGQKDCHTIRFDGTHTIEEADES